MVSVMTWTNHSHMCQTRTSSKNLGGTPLQRTCQKSDEHPRERPPLDCQTYNGSDAEYNFSDDSHCPNLLIGPNFRNSKTFAHPQTLVQLGPTFNLELDFGPTHPPMMVCFPPMS